MGNFQHLQCLYLNFVQPASEADLIMIKKQLSTILKYNIQVYIQDTLYIHSMSINVLSNYITQKNQSDQMNYCTGIKSWVASQRTYILYSLQRLSKYLYRMGYLEQNRESIKQIVKVQRELNKIEPETYSRQFFFALKNLGSELHNLEHFQEAVQYNTEAVEIGNILASQNPTISKYILADTLNNAGNTMYNLGLYQDAFIYNQRAMRLRYSLAQVDPIAFKSLLAKSLHDMASDLISLGYSSYEEALKYNKEGLKIMYILSNQDPKPYKSILVDSLTRVGDNLHNLGQFWEAYRYDQEAVEISRELANQNPERFNSLLTQCLNNVGVDLHNLGCYQNALRWHQEAAILSRILGCDKGCLLEESLTNAGANYRNLGYYQKAVECDQEVIEIQRTIVSQDPSAKGVANHLHSLGRVERDLQSDQEALESICTLDTSDQNPQALGFPADSLNNAFVNLHRLSCIALTVKCSQEVVEVAQLLAHWDAGGFTPLLVDLLQDVGPSFCEVECNEEETKIERARFDRDLDRTSSEDSQVRLTSPRSLYITSEVPFIGDSSMYSKPVLGCHSKNPRKRILCNHQNARSPLRKIPGHSPTQNMPLPALHQAQEIPGFRTNFKHGLRPSSRASPLLKRPPVSRSPLRSTCEDSHRHKRRKMSDNPARLDLNPSTKRKKGQYRYESTSRPLDSFRGRPWTQAIDRSERHESGSYASDPPSCRIMPLRRLVDLIKSRPGDMMPLPRWGRQTLNGSQTCKVTFSPIASLTVTDHVSSISGYLECSINGSVSLGGINYIRVHFSNYHVTRGTQESDVELGDVISIGISWSKHIGLDVNPSDRQLYLFQTLESLEMKFCCPSGDLQAIDQQLPQTIKSKVNLYVNGFPCDTPVPPLLPSPIPVTQVPFSQENERVHCSQIKHRLGMSPY